jgi:hypothetical protein
MVIPFFQFISLSSLKDCPGVNNHFNSHKQYTILPLLKNPISLALNSSGSLSIYDFN